jgi:predicted deacylase
MKVVDRVFVTVCFLFLACVLVPAAIADPGSGSSNTPAYEIDIQIREVGAEQPGEDSGDAQDPADAPEADEDRDDVETEPVDDDKRPAFKLLGSSVPAGETRRLQWSGIESFVGNVASSPVIVAHGSFDGPVLCLSAAVHGDELNGIEIIRRVMHDLDAKELSGTVVGVPIVNVYGFQRASRYLPDRRDLNRYFPGSPGGSSASRIAYAFFEGVIRHCDMLVDIHTGSFHRTNLTQLRADVSRDDVRDLCAGFGEMPVLHNLGSHGTLRRAATDAGIPTVTIEAGEPMRLEAKVVNRGVAGIDDLLAHTKMVKTIRLFGSPQPLFYQSTWVRSDSGGILFSLVSLGDSVDAGDKLATVTDPITNRRAYIRSPYSGTILGKAVNQFVMPGFALFRVGIETSGEEIEESGPPPKLVPEPVLEPRPPIDPGLDLEERPE